MTLAYWCVLIAIFLPYLGTASAKFLGAGYGPRANSDPRAFLAGLEGWRRSANNAQLNGFEVTPAAPRRVCWISWRSPSWSAGCCICFATWPTGGRSVRWCGLSVWA